MDTKIIESHIIKYFILSCLASVIDIFVSYILYKTNIVHYLLACNMGIISGIIFQYVSSMKYVFKQENVLYSLGIYIVTFFLGLAIANGTMYVGYELVSLSFIFAKLLSMAVPFFFIYFLRRKLLGVKTQVVEEA